MNKDMYNAPPQTTTTHVAQVNLLNLATSDLNLYIKQVWFINILIKLGLDYDRGCGHIWFKWGELMMLLIDYLEFVVF